MKRKSEIISPSVIRRACKHKTMGWVPSQRRSTHLNSHQSSEEIISQIINEINQDVQNKINQIAEKRLISGLI